MRSKPNPLMYILMLMILSCAIPEPSGPSRSNYTSQPEPTPTQDPAKPVPRDEVEEREWALKEAIDEWAAANVRYLSYAAERISLELELSQPRSSLRDVEKEKNLERLGQWEVQAQDDVSWWAKEGEARVRRLNEALARHPDRKPEFDWQAYHAKKSADPAWVDAGQEFSAARSRSGAAAEQADQVNLGIKIQAQERETEYLRQEAAKQQEEVDRLRQRYFDVRSEAEKADGANGFWRQDVQDAKAAHDRAELDLSAKQLKADEAQRVLDELKTQKR